MKLSNEERKPPDILSDPSETVVYCLSDPSVLVSNRNVALPDVNQNVAGGERITKWITGLSVDIFNYFFNFLLLLLGGKLILA